MVLAAGFVVDFVMRDGKSKEMKEKLLKFVNNVMWLLELYSEEQKRMG